MPKTPVPECPRLPRPLVRSALTVANPRGGLPVTVEVIVLTESDDGEVTAEVSDLPELRHAGWRHHEISNLDVWTRVIHD
jgi:hypothetical protein